MLFFLPRGTEMFQFPRFPLITYVFSYKYHNYLWWVSPFGYPRIKARLTATRGLSQPSTSFIGIRRQGIHRWLFVTWRINYKMLVLAIGFSMSFVSTLSFIYSKS